MASPSAQQLRQKKSGMPPANPPDYLARRVDRVRQALLAAKVPALLVTSFPDVSWLTGFEGDDSHAIITPDRLLLISDSRYEEQISREAPWTALVLRKKTIWEETARQLKRLKLQKIAVQPESLTLQGQATLSDFLKKKRTKVRLKAVADIIVTLRHIKDAHEIAIIEEAIRVAQDAFTALRAQLRPGMTENDIAGRLGYEMRKRGALNSAFDSIIAAGPNGSLPHYRPADARLSSRGPLLLDWGARCRGYVSDLTRVLLIGDVEPQIREIYSIVLDAQLAAIAAIKPGAHGKKVDKAARDLITKAGYGDQFGHGTGHGIGREIHEAISLSKLSTTTLKPGMIITVEPGIYLPGKGGVRIEDDVLVTDTGCRVLSTLAKDLASASLTL